MKSIGGEAELKSDEFFFYITDSGRSSLRLLLEHGMKHMKFLLPDYLCKTILDVFNALEISYDFYHVNTDLSVSLQELDAKTFDVLYVINYFGRRDSVYEEVALRKDVMMIEDCVFSPWVDKPKNLRRWIGFNSFRKISYLPEGSMIVSSQELPQTIISREAPEFVQFKYKAKDIKYEYFKNGRYSETQYLELFRQAGELLNQQSTIHAITNRGLLHLFAFYKDMEREYIIRRENFEILNRYLQDLAILIVAQYPSFYVLNVDRRDALREYLFSKKIFLPIHWPEIEGIKNILCQRVLSIPVDSRYSKDEMVYLSQCIRNFYSLPVI